MWYEAFRTKNRKPATRNAMLVVYQIRAKNGPSKDPSTRSFGKHFDLDLLDTIVTGHSRELPAQIGAQKPQLAGPRRLIDPDDQHPAD